MDRVIFDLKQLNKLDRLAYEKMSPTEKASFEKIWMQIEEAKLKLQQQKNVSKERAAREKKILAERERKERTHRLIERGAILEAYIDDPLDFSSEEIKEIVMMAMQETSVKAFIGQVRARRTTNTEIYTEKNEREDNPMLQIS